MEKAAFKAEVKVVDGVLLASVELDLVDALKEVSGESPIVKAVLSIVESVKANIDWAGAKKEAL